VTWLKINETTPFTLITIFGPMGSPTSITSQRGQVGLPTRSL